MPIIVILIVTIIIFCGCINNGNNEDEEIELNLNITLDSTSYKVNNSILMNIRLSNIGKADVQVLDMQYSTPKSISINLIDSSNTTFWGESYSHPNGSRYLTRTGTDPDIISLEAGKEILLEIDLNTLVWRNSNTKQINESLFHKGGEFKILVIYEVDSIDDTWEGKLTSNEVVFSVTG